MKIETNFQGIIFPNTHSESTAAIVACREARTRDIPIAFRLRGINGVAMPGDDPKVIMREILEDQWARDEARLRRTSHG